MPGSPSWLGSLSRHARDAGGPPLFSLEVGLALAPAWCAAFCVVSGHKRLAEWPYALPWPEDEGEPGLDQTERHLRAHLREFWGGRYVWMVRGTYRSETIAILCAEGFITWSQPRSQHVGAKVRGVRAHLRPMRTPPGRGPLHRDMVARFVPVSTLTRGMDGRHPQIRGRTVSPSSARIRFTISLESAGDLVVTVRVEHPVICIDMKQSTHFNATTSPRLNLLRSLIENRSKSTMSLHGESSGFRVG